jgi:hypothetical protein
VGDHPAEGELAVGKSLLGGSTVPLHCENIIAFDPAPVLVTGGEQHLTGGVALA